MVYFVTKNCVNVGNDKDAIIRTEALKRCYEIDGYAQLPLEVKNNIYDVIVKEVEEELG